MTVRGPVPASELGTTMAHEHVVFDLGTYYTRADDEPDDAGEDGWVPVAQDRLWWLRTHPMNSRANLVHDDVELAVTELNQFAAAGGRTVVDQTVAGIGPQPDLLVEVSERTGVHIVAGTGFYIPGSYPAEVAEWPVEAIADRLRQELTAGIAGSDVRAGMIGELGVSEPLLPFEQRLLAAAGKVQAETGCAVAIHTPWSPEGVRATAIAAEAAALDPARTALCHLDNRFGDATGHYRDVARHGFMLSMDCFGRDCYYPHLDTQLPSDAQRIRALTELLDSGLDGQILVSQDICFVHELAAKGGHGYAHILRSIVPRLRRAGVTDEALHRILVENPAAWLAGG
nr:hypothetical protein [Phytoactinopolyspora alkaliphila]